jgi:hypothetical protein
MQGDGGFTAVCHRNRLLFPLDCCPFTRWASFPLQNHGSAISPQRDEPLATSGRTYPIGPLYPPCRQQAIQPAEGNTQQFRCPVGGDAMGGINRGHPMHLSPASVAIKHAPVHHLEPTVFCCVDFHFEYGGKCVEVLFQGDFR